MIRNISGQANESRRFDPSQVQNSIMAVHVENDISSASNDGGCVEYHCTMGFELL